MPMIEGKLVRRAQGYVGPILLSLSSRSTQSSKSVHANNCKLTCSFITSSRSLCTTKSFAFSKTCRAKTESLSLYPLTENQTPSEYEARLYERSARDAS